MTPEGEAVFISPSSRTGVCVYCTCVCVCVRARARARARVYNVVHRTQGGVCVCVCVCVQPSSRTGLRELVQALELRAASSPTRRLVRVSEVCASVNRDPSYGKRDLLHTQKRPTDILTLLRYAEVSKETYSYGKRPQTSRRCRPRAVSDDAHVSKETYSYGKRALQALTSRR